MYVHILVTDWLLDKTSCGFCFEKIESYKNEHKGLKISNAMQRIDKMAKY